MKCLLVGNYGVGNIGDEALKEFFLQKFPEINWTVVSAHPNTSAEVPRLPCGIRSFFQPWWKTLHAIWSSDAVVFGGGSLFTDIESVRACILWWMYACIAWITCTPYYFAFQGFGPFHTKAGQWFAYSALRHAAWVSVRDEESVRRVETARSSRNPPVLSFDPAFSLFVSSIQPTGAHSSNLVIIPRANSGIPFFDEVKRQLAIQSEAVTILLLEPDAEKKVAHELAMLAPRSRIVKVQSIHTLLQEVSAARHAIVQRYHGALAAIAAGVPVTIIPQAAGDKMAVLGEMVRKGCVREEWLTQIEKGVEGLRSSLRST